MRFLRSPAARLALGILALGAAAILIATAPLVSAALLVGAVFLLAGKHFKVAAIVAVALPALVSAGALAGILDLESGNTVQKALMMGAVLLAVLLIGVRNPGWPWMLLVGTLVVFTAGGVVGAVIGLDGMSAADKINSFLGYLLPWLVLLARVGSIRLDHLLAVIAALPLMALAIGVVLELHGIDSLTSVEYTGATRLTGPLTPAYMASFGMFGAIASLWWWLRGPWIASVLALVNLAITALTGTRGPLLVAAVFLLAVLLFGRRNGRPIPLLPRLATLGAAAVAAAVTLPALITRTFAQGFSSGLSGREVAWSFFLDAYWRSPWIGAGPGGANFAAENSGSAYLERNFTAPHNTYLQLLVDFGAIGAVAIVGAVVWMYVQLHRRNTDRNFRLITAVFFCGLAGYAFFDNLLTSPHPSIMFTLFLALFYAEAERKRPATAAGPQR